jgi:hypothetical protein
MAKIKVTVAGAPFDEGNIFYIPATDGGPIISLYPTSNVVNIDGGFFRDAPTDSPLVDGGVIPAAGTASYDPTKEYGPDDIIELEFEI